MDQKFAVRRENAYGGGWRESPARRDAAPTRTSSFDHHHQTIMRRSSAYPTRASHAGSQASKASQSQLLAKVEEKKKEADALSALERLSAEYVRRLSAIDYDAMVMADAGKGALCPMTV